MSWLPISFRKRIDLWIASHSPPQQGPILIHRRRLYILPTRFGYLYAFMLLALFLAAINYENSMAYVLTFLLTALGIMTLWQTNKNLLGLEFELKPIKPVFSGEEVTFQFEILNNTLYDRFAIGIQYQNESPIYCRVEAQSSSKLLLNIPSHYRGQFQPDGFTVFSRFPTGLFHTWSWLKIDQPVHIYPKPLKIIPLKESLQHQQNTNSTIDTADGDDFAGLREHRPGESLKHISWKAYAQGRGMLTKTFQGYASSSLWIDWNDINAHSIEEKLSIMASMVIQSSKAGLGFGLRLPGIELPTSSGSSHKNQCLYQLSVFKQPDFDSPFMAVRAEP